MNTYRNIFVMKKEGICEGCQVKCQVFKTEFRIRFEVAWIRIRPPRKSGFEEEPSESSGYLICS